MANTCSAILTLRLFIHVLPTYDFMCIVLTLQAKYLPKRPLLMTVSGYSIFSQLSTPLQSDFYDEQILYQAQQS
jgi:hypothetical protein